MQFKNETYLAEISQIMDSFNQYVPAEMSSKKITVNESEYNIDDTKIMQLLFFGDQLTVTRACSAAALREPQKKNLIG